MKRRLKITEAMLFEIVILIFLAILIFVSSDLPARTKRLPLLIAWVTVLLTLGDLLISIVKQHLKGRETQGSLKMTWDKATFIKTGGSVLFMIATLLLWKLVGFVITSTVVTIAFSLFMGAKNKIGLILASIGLTFGLYYIFGNFLNVPLPRGMLVSWLF
jgi:hypothetical protein